MKARTTVADTGPNESAADVRNPALTPSIDWREAEAERVATRIMASPPGLSAREPPPSSPSSPSEEPGRSRGQPIPASEREFFELRFGRDFGNVRIFSDERSEQEASRVGARAFTVGSDIAFGRGAYQPGTSTGRRVLAHELTHVVQQTRVAQTGQANSPVAHIGAGQPTGPTVQRLPAPPRMAVRRPGLSSIGPIYKNTYDGTASTTIKPGWSESSWERKWSLYDADDKLVDSVSYTVPQPTYVVPRHHILATRAGGAAAPWSVWHEVTKTLNPLGTDDPEYFPYDYVTFPVYDTEAEHRAREADAAEDERLGIGVARPKGLAPGRPANTMVTPEVALKLIENQVAGRPAFRPELGKGGASWFITEGEPYTGTSPAKSVNIQVELTSREGLVQFDEARLQKMHAEEVAKSSAEAEAKYREHNSIPEDQTLNSKARKGLARFSKRFAESRMWDRVGQIVRQSASKAGEVVLRNSTFSTSGDGTFAVVADATKIRLKGGVKGVLEALSKAGATAQPTVVEAAEALAKKQKWAGRVRGVFRYGGRLLLVVAVAADLYKIYYAQDKLKAVLTTVGGWAGAIAAGGAFAVWFTPADTAGPLAWAAHGVGTLVAGGVGYWIGSSTVRYIYELVAV